MTIDYLQELHQNHRSWMEDGSTVRVGLYPIVTQPLYTRFPNRFSRYLSNMSVG